jgi:hypothetical protein
MRIPAYVNDWDYGGGGLASAVNKHRPSLPGAWIAIREAKEDKCR